MVWQGIKWHAMATRPSSNYFYQKMVFATSTKPKKTTFDYHLVINEGKNLRSHEGKKLSCRGSVHRIMLLEDGVQRRSCDSLLQF